MEEGSLDAAGARMKRPQDATQGCVGIVFFGEDWGRHNSTGQYLARELSLRHPVIWVDSLGLRTPKFSWSDLARIASKLKKVLGKRTVGSSDSSSGSGSVRVLTPLAIPYYRSRLVRRFNRVLLSRLIERARRAAGFERMVVITACPATADIVAKLKTEATVYYCADEYSEQPGVDAALARNLERELLRRVDVVVASAQRLAERKARLHPDVRYLPHGVHYEHFSRAARETLPCPADLRSIPAPRVGYVGLLGIHVDFAAIERIAQELPEAHLVLIGPVEDACVERLPRGDNIHYLGPRAHETLPAYLAHFDVCLLPWLDNERNRNANPTKLREYLAAGCPVVATPVEEAEPLAHLFRSARDPRSFAEQTKAALKDAHREGRAALSQTMADADWANRAAELWDIIDTVSRTRRTEAPRATPVLEQGG